MIIAGNYLKQIENEISWLLRRIWLKNKAKLVNLGAYKDKCYHFDFENKTLLEEVRPPNYWSYILVPITVYVLRFLMTGIEKTGIFESEILGNHRERVNRLY